MHYMFKNEELNVGMTVAVGYTVKPYNWGSSYKYQTWETHVIKRITPKRTVAELDDGSRCDIKDSTRLYRPDDDMKKETEISRKYLELYKGAGDISNKKDILSKVKDEDILLMYEYLAAVMEILNKY